MQLIKDLMTKLLPVSVLMQHRINASMKQLQILLV